MSITEFNLIDRFFNKTVTDSNHVVLGIGDDAALLRPDSNSGDHIQVLTASSTLLEDTDFEADQDPAIIGQKLLEKPIGEITNQSAQAVWATLSLILSETDETWLQAFSDGLFETASGNGIQLVGGDTTQGPRKLLTVQVYGVKKL
ncbi:MAG: hypothetical protein KAR30_10340 [Gammaproteobacteria bacterium]|nr:hypothetical protein [Gammaproteobacteria bacterium]